MADPVPRDDDVVEIVDYLRGTIAELDKTLAELTARRLQFAMKLAALEAADDPAVKSAVHDYAGRVAENRPYEGAQDAERALSEAFKKHGAE